MHDVHLLAVSRPLQAVRQPTSATGFRTRCFVGQVSGQTSRSFRTHLVRSWRSAELEGGRPSYQPLRRRAAIDIEEQRMAHFHDAPREVGRERAFSRRYQDGRARPICETLKVATASASDSTNHTFNPFPRIR